MNNGGNGKKDRRIWLSRLIVVPVVFAAALAAAAAMYVIYTRGGDRPSVGTVIAVTAIVGAVASLAAVYILGKRAKSTYNLLLLTMQDIISKGKYNEKGMPEYLQGTQLSSEIEKVSDSLRELGESNRRLTGRNKHLTGRQKELEFNLMTSKASPLLVHSLCESISKQTKDGSYESVLAMAAYAGSLAQRSVEDSTQLVPLAEELKMISEYLRLDELVTGHRTGYKLSVLCNIVKYRMIPHVIMPIVDNFIRLASRDKTPHYEIHIEVTASYDELMITIRDNGYGIDQHDMDRIIHEMESEDIDMHEDYISLANVNRRIKWHYGDKYGLKLSGSRLGSVIQVTLPPQSE